MKDDLVSDPTKDRGGHGGLRNVLVHLGHEHWYGGGPRPPPKWGSMSRDLVTTVVRGAASRTVSSGLPVWTCLGSSTFHARTVHAALVDCKAFRSITGGSCFIGALSKTTTCHGNTLDLQLLNNI